MEFLPVGLSIANKINRQPREETKYRRPINYLEKFALVPPCPVTRIVCRFNRLRTHAKGICSDIPICRNLSFPPFFNRLALIGATLCLLAPRELATGIYIRYVPLEIEFTLEMNKIQKSGNVQNFTFASFSGEESKNDEQIAMRRTLQLEYIIFIYNDYEFNPVIFTRNYVNY